jgi:dienelactone hydrolase
MHDWWLFASGGPCVKSHRIAWHLAVPLIAIVASGCGLAPQPATAPSRSISATTTVQLHGKSLELHLSAPAATVNRAVLVVYASGDGGWFGAAVDMFKQIAAAGYYAVGFSSKSFLHIERPRGALVGVRELAAEYARITRSARIALGLDDSVPVVLTGWSRGAAFAVLVASEPAARRPVAGVVAIGMAAGENLRLDDADNEGDDDPTNPQAGHALFEPYARIAQLGDLPCAVIQATHDNYLPASRARAMFGADTPTRRFYSIDAKNHRFSGGREAFDTALGDALRFVAGSAHAVER